MNSPTIHDELILELFLNDDGSVKDSLLLPDPFTEALEMMIKNLIDRGLLQIQGNKCYLTEAGHDAALNYQSTKH